MSPIFNFGKVRHCRVSGWVYDKDYLHNSSSPMDYRRRRAAEKMTVTKSENNSSARNVIASHIDENLEKEQESIAIQSETNLTQTELMQSTNVYSLELSVLVLSFSLSLTEPMFQTEIFQQSCMLKNNESICGLIANKQAPEELKHLETELEIYVSKIFMVGTVLGSIFPVFISFFIVQWSDRFGRKPLLLSSFLGFFLSYALLCVISIASHYYKINPWFYVLAFIPLSIFGSPCTLSTGVYTYINDISLPQDRSLRLARLEAILLLGSIMGILTFVYIKISTPVAFGCSTLCIFFGLCCIYFFVDESIKIEIEPISCIEKFRALYDWKHVADIFSTTFKRREHNGRILLWLVIATLVLAAFSSEGAASEHYLFVRDRFKWMPTDFALYSAFNMICKVFGNLIGIYVLHKMFGMPEIFVILISLFSAMTDHIFIGLADYSIQLYIAAVVFMIKVVSFPLCRSYLASLVPSSDIGKVFSVIKSLELLVTIAAVPLYTFIYDNTIATYPGAFNLFSAIIFIICILLMTTVFYIRGKWQETANYERMTT
ncbi:proton-coupled folate transporter-like [Contarinia nasturtii]|uniref:proton-coupled folate transporter-like n=1 Tax=Contarinia nasturtii TaxID=265458 RepID=UPI0012D48813|nr:proton-coupled folate transporter-like [Contarinia nasturtii]